jgi:hypothetical protein
VFRETLPSMARVRPLKIDEPQRPATRATLSFVFVGWGFSLRAVLSVNQ